MPHFLLLGGISAHAAGMGKASAPTTLIAPASLSYRSAADLFRTRCGTVNLTTVAVAANEHLRAAAPAQKESPHRFHRLALHRAEQLSLSTGRGNPWNNRPAHVFGTLWGTASGQAWRFTTVSCLFCSATSFLPHVAPHCHPLGKENCKSPSKEISEYRIRASQ